MKKHWVVVGLAVTLGLGFLAGILVQWPLGTGGGSTQGGDPMKPRRGADKPLVVIHELSDFQCPYCSKGALEVLHAVEQKYAGKVAVEFHNNPLPMHNMAMPAAKAALAACLQGKFWAMHDWLFKNAKGLSDERIQGAARSLGLNMDRFNWDLQDPRIEEAIRSDQMVAAAMGLAGTPMFVIHGQVIRGAQPVEEFSKIIDAELEKAQAALAAGTAPEALQEQLSVANGAPEPFLKHWVKGEKLQMPETAEKKNPVAIP